MADINLARLRNDPFWRKKFTKFLECHDENKDGHVTRAEYILEATRFKDRCLTDSSRASAEALVEVVNTLLDMMGLDESKKMSYAEFEGQFLNVVGKQMLTGKLGRQLYGSMFDAIDANSDGSIDLDKWRVLCECRGIPVEHAKASFVAMDADHDDLITRKEFLDYQFEFIFTSEDELKSSILYGPLD